MNILRIFVDGQLSYHPQLSEPATTEARMTKDAEDIGNLTLSAPFNHPYLDSIHLMASTIACKRGDATVSEGRALDDDSDFYSTHTWTCESAPVYLKDSQQPPLSYKGTLKDLLEYLLPVHNKAAEEKKRFKLGNITVTDSSNYISYSNSEYSCTLDAIESKLIDTHGGCLMIRYTESEKVLDYLAELSTHSIQFMEYGKNFIDIKITRGHTKRITAPIPLGARKKATDEEGNEAESNGRVNTASVNDGLDYIYDDVVVEKIGWTWAIGVRDDVTLPRNLLRKAKVHFTEPIAGIVSTKLTIVDGSDTGVDIGSVHARQFVDCSFPPRGINRRCTCMSKTADYLNPSGDTITTGASGIRLTGISAKQNANIIELTDDLTGKTAEIQSVIAKADATEATAKSAKEAINTVTDDITTLQGNVRERYSEILKTSEEIDLTVREKYISRPETAAIQQNLQSTITQNSNEVRMDFFAITDELKGNIAANQGFLEEYIHFRGALIELDKMGSIFTAELSNNELVFKKNGQKITYIFNSSLAITDTEIRSKLSLGSETRGRFDSILRNNGNLLIK